MYRSMNNVRWASVIAAAGFTFAIAPEAAAETELQIDLNSIVASSGAGFSTTYSGTITLSDDGDSALGGILIDGLTQTIGAGFVLSDLTGTITTSVGAVTGGSFTIDVYDGSRTDTYTAMITPMSGSITTQAGQGFSIDGLTFSGSFSTDIVAGPPLTFAGVDVGSWDAFEPLFGSFINFAYNPDGAGLDTNANLDVFVLVPAPLAAPWGLAGLIGIIVARRRNKRRVAA